MVNSFETIILKINLISCHFEIFQENTFLNKTKNRFIYKKIKKLEELASI
jgi:hypothetical protein